MSRAETRLRLVLRAALRAPLRRPRRVADPRTIFIAHHLLLGDTLMLAPLFAALRGCYPQARIVTACAPAYLTLFAGRPWGVEAVPYHPRQPASLRAVLAALRGEPLDLALLPGDNRHALLARACGARWIVGFCGDSPSWKNRLCDELLPWPDAPETVADLFARLAGASPAAYVNGQWPAPPQPPGLQLPSVPYAVLHLGAGNPLRLWMPERWAELAAALQARGITPVLSAGPGEEALVQAVDPVGQYAAYPGTLALAGLWHLVANARLLVCLDSGIAHLAKLTGTPTVCLFGQGNDQLFGAGTFFAQQPFFSLIERDIPCRDQQTLFGRELPWVRRCARRPDACSRAICMEALTVAQVVQACETRIAVDSNIQKAGG